MSRISASQVEVLIPKGVTPGQFSMAIESASFIVDELLAADTAAVISSSGAVQIELYLAAHFAELFSTQGPLSSTKLGSSEDAFHNIYGSGLKATRFGQHAVQLDRTGYLAAQVNRVITPGLLTAVFRVV